MDRSDGIYMRKPRDTREHSATSDTGKAIVKIATIKIPVGDLPNIMAKKAILLLEAFLIDLFKSLEMIPNAPIIR